jgi:hypothetical protein
MSHGEITLQRTMQRVLLHLLGCGLTGHVVKSGAFDTRTGILSHYMVEPFHVPPSRLSWVQYPVQLGVGLAVAEKWVHE